MKTELIAVKGRVKTRPFQLADGERLIVGRAPEAHIQILDSGLSRLHCSIEKRGEDFWITDLASRNGTFVNDQPVQCVKLHSGDKIRIGVVEFEFRCVMDRRHVDADIIASVPERGGSIEEDLSIDESNLMTLDPEYENVENFRRVQRDLATIYKLGNLISAERESQALYQRILDVILKVSKADRGFLILASRNGELVLHSKKESNAIPPERAHASYSHTIVEECFSKRRSILRANAMEDDQFGEAKSVLELNILSVLCVPIETADSVLGVIYVDTMSEAQAFTKQDLELLLAVGRQAGVAIHRVQLGEQLRELLRGTVRALVAAIEAKDEYTKGHSQRVTAYALAIGQEMKMNEQELATLELAGLLHDVGKIGVPESILRKAGPLTEPEYEIVKGHARLGGNIVRNIEDAHDIVEAVLHHHERWDGGGYPIGLRGGDIPQLARILSVADAFDAMSSQRPYRDRLAQEKILRTLREASGTQFDAMVVDAFLRAVESGRLILDEPQRRAKR